MAIDYFIDKDLGLTIVRWHGIVTADEFLAHTHKLCADPNWPPFRFFHLSDLRTANLHESIDGDLLFKIAEMYSTHPKIRSFRIAIVAAQAFDKAMVFQRLLQSHASVIPFYDINVACTWLGVSPEQTGLILQSLGASR